MYSSGDPQDTPPDLSDSQDTRVKRKYSISKLLNIFLVIMMIVYYIKVVAPPLPITNQINTELLVDTSESMNESFGDEKTKWDELKESLKDKVLLNTASSDNLALRTFGGKCGANEASELLIPWSNNNSDKILSEIDGIKPQGQATFTKGLIEATGDFANRAQSSKNSIWFLTGGKSECAINSESLLDRVELTGGGINYSMYVFVNADKKGDISEEMLDLFTKLSERSGGKVFFTPGIEDLITSMAKAKNEAYTRDQKKSALEFVRLATQYRWEEDYNESHIMFEKASTLFTKAKHPNGVALVLVGLGDLARHLSDEKNSRERYKEALKLYKADKDERGHANVLYGLAYLEYDLAELEKAWVLFNRASMLYKKIQDKRGQANVLIGFGEIEYKNGRLEKAREYFKQGIGVYKEEGDARGHGNALVKLSNLEVKAGHCNRGRHHFESAIELYKKEGLIQKVDRLPSETDRFDGC